MKNNPSNQPVIIKKIVEYVSWFLGLSFVLGFFIWSTYLYGLGFKEDNLLQTRFIFTGISFLIISIPVIGIFLWLIKHIKKIKNFWKRKMIEVLLITAGIIYYFIFIFFVFTNLPIFLGGGRPRGLSIMAGADELTYLSSFGIPLAAGSTAQTANLCVAYESNNNIVVVLADRVMQINSNNFKGLINLPGISIPLSRDCSRAVRLWINKTLSLELLSNDQIQELENKAHLMNTK